MNETLKVLKERRSIRSYKPEQLREEDLQPILEAGTWAATAKNLQSPVMVVVQDPETIAHMSALNAEILGRTPSSARPRWWWSWRTGSWSTGFRTAPW